MAKIVYPPRIKKGDTIGVTATSKGVTEEHYKKLEKAYDNLLKLGYKHIETNNVRKMYKMASSDGKTRAKEFMELWKNKEISLITNIVGGYFLIEMLPYLDKDVFINSTPKWTNGFSDSSILLFYLTTNFNIATVHAPSSYFYGVEELNAPLINGIKILEDGNTSVQESFELYEKERFDHRDKFAPTEKVEYKHLYNKTKDKIVGRLIGGNVLSLSYLMGSDADNVVKFCSQFEEGIIWYLEDCSLPVANFYLTLLQMKNNGWFKNANGFIIGRTMLKEDYYDFTYEDAMHRVFDDMNVPVIYDIDVGHVEPQWTMINGAYAEFEYNDGKGKIIQKLI